MSSLVTLVTASQWTPEAERIVQSPGSEIAYLDGPVTEDALIERLAATGAQALVLRGSPPVTARVLAAAPALRIVAKNGAGVDSVDIAEAKRRHIAVAVAVAAGATAYAVAEHALAMMLALVRSAATRRSWRRRRAHASACGGAPVRPMVSRPSTTWPGCCRTSMC